MDLLPTATSPDEAQRAASVALLPVGSFEQHGDHLPLSTDTLIACLIARRIADDYELFLLPPITISCSHEHAHYAGTVSLDARTVMSIVDDVRGCLARSGVHRLVLVNAHGGNYVLSNITQQANIDSPRIVLFPGRMDWDVARDDAGMATSTSDDMHAGELETSLLLYAYPELVRDSYLDSDHLANPRPHLLVTGMRGCTANGVIGRPFLATAEKGRAVLDSLAASFTDHLETLTACSAAE
ncbi:MAG: creatininase family protein [Egibacteraceae bacterium]